MAVPIQPIGRHQWRWRCGRSRGDVDGQGAEGVERRLVAGFQLLRHVGLDHVHGHTAGAFDHGLHVVLPGDLRQLAQVLQLGKLRLVVGVAGAAGAQAVAQAERRRTPS